jgi:hypothetical protein
MKITWYFILYTSYDNDIHMYKYGKTYISD